MIRVPVLAAAWMLATVAPVAAQEAPDPAPAPATAPGEQVVPAEDALDLETIPATLMMTLEDMIAVEDAIAAGPLARVAGQGDQADSTRFRLNTPLYVSAIIHSGRNAWTVWINGRPFRPGDTSDLFEIVQVSPYAARLAIPWGEGGTREISLAPHQTFVPRMGSVIEGRWG